MHNNTRHSTRSVQAASEFHSVSQILPLPPETEHIGWALYDSYGSQNRILAQRRFSDTQGTQLPLFPLYLIDKEDMRAGETPLLLKARLTAKKVYEDHSLMLLNGAFLIFSGAPEAAMILK